MCNKISLQTPITIKAITPEAVEQLAEQLNMHLVSQDTVDLAQISGLYLSPARCTGGRYVPRGYVCPWCGSNQPTGPNGYCNDKGVCARNADVTELPEREGGWKHV